MLLKILKDFPKLRKSLLNSSLSSKKILSKNSANLVVFAFIHWFLSSPIKTLLYCNQSFLSIFCFSPTSCLPYNKCLFVAVVALCVATTSHKKITHVIPLYMCNVFQCASMHFFTLKLLELVLVRRTYFGIQFLLSLLCMCLCSYFSYFWCYKLCYKIPLDCITMCSG